MIISELSRLCKTLDTVPVGFLTVMWKRFVKVLSIGILGLSCQVAAAEESPLLDCPLRDAPFSVDLPLIDVFLSPAAVAVMQHETPQLLQGMPDSMVTNTAPTMGAIMSVRNAAAIRQIPAEDIVRLNNALNAVPLSDDDRRARCLRYDNDQPEFEPADSAVHLLVFKKINGHDHGASVDAATRAVLALADELGWSVSVTDKGGAFTPDTLARFDAVIWNNVSGDALNFWDWYVNTLLGARFIGHPMDPQLQDADIRIEEQPSGIGATVAPGWIMQDEWYSFQTSPRAAGASVIATLDEESYTQKGYGGTDLRMGDDHPIVWTRCVGDGRVFYTAIGHRPEVYNVPQTIRLLKDGVVWAAGKGNSTCSFGKEQEIQE